MTPGQVLARLADLADPCAIVVRSEHDLYASVIVTRRGDAIAAFRNKCPHAGYPLQRSDGRIVVQEGRYMVCAAHGASFTFDGACAGGPCNGDGLEPFPFEIRDGLILAR